MGITVSPPGGFLLLLGGIALVLVAAGCSGSSSSSHSLSYFCMGVSEPGPGLPQFVAVGYMDNQPIDRYDSHTQRRVPMVPWMEQFRKEDSQYWETQSQIVQSTNSLFRAHLEILRDCYNQSRGGFHTLQVMYGCEVGPDGQLRWGYYQDAYDGEDFIVFDGETHTWTARAPQAQLIKKQWEKDNYIERRKSYLEDTCVEWLGRYLGYSNKTLQRTERPIARVSHKKGFDGRATLFCQLYGFYPKEIEVTWMKDGEDRAPETHTGGVIPNSDGTYHTWLSIEVDPKEKDRYRCRVGHDSLPEPLELAWEEPTSNLGLILGIAFGVLLPVSILVGITVFLRNWKKKGYEIARSDQGSDSSTSEPFSVADHTSPDHA